MTTKIEWVKSEDGSQGDTWNPVRGCSRVSAGCDNCYAMIQAHRFSGPGKPYEGLTTIRRGKVDWTGVARFIPEQLAVPLRRKKPTTYFVNSMSDLFHHSLSNEQIAAVVGVMAACPQHTFQVLTKRAKRALEWFEWIRQSPVSLGGPTVNAARGVKWFAWNHIDEIKVHDPEHPWVWPLPNVHLGVSCENQETADKRIPLLLQCPAAVRWVSAEPLLGGIDFERVQWPQKHPVDVLRGGAWEFGGVPGFTQHSDMNKLDWVVVGGEAGHSARPFDVEWAESIVRQCKEANVSVFVKQLGAYVVAPWASSKEWPTAQFTDLNRATRIRLKHRKGADMNEWPKDLRVRQFPGLS